MSDLLHRLKVFVFRYEERAPSYLLLRPAQGIEAFWGPVQGTLGFGEKVEAAIRREVMEDIGLRRSRDLIDLRLTHRWELGDEQVIEWNYGLCAVQPADALELDQRWADFRWMDFGEAYPALELESDRAAILRLHTILG